MLASDVSAFRSASTKLPVSDASSQSFALIPLGVGIRLLDRMDWFTSAGHPFIHMETEKLLSPSNTSSVPPVETVAKVPFDRSKDFPVPDMDTIEGADGNHAGPLNTVF